MLCTAAAGQNLCSPNRHRNAAPPHGKARSFTPARPRHGDRTPPASAALPLPRPRERQPEPLSRGAATPCPRHGILTAEVVETGEIHDLSPKAHSDQRQPRQRHTAPAARPRAGTGPCAGGKRGSDGKPGAERAGPEQSVPARHSLGKSGFWPEFYARSNDFSHSALCGSDTWQLIDIFGI